ncbi:MAG: hypothetical protein U0350_44480 [Caldilineaceae bacterium]
MAKSYRDLLHRLDAIGLSRYQITNQDVQTVEQYLALIQAGLIGETTWQEMMRYAGPYGTSILIHEIVEIRTLEAKGLKPLRQKTRQLRKLLAEHVEAHVLALYEEHRYLQEVINRLYGVMLEVATLVKANRNDEVDLQLFLDSNIGVFRLEEERVAEARAILSRLKEE